MISRYLVASALMLTFLSSLAFAPGASAAKSAQKHGKGRASKAAEPAPDPAKPAADNAAASIDNVAIPVADNAVGLQGVVHETDITATIVTGRPVAMAPVTAPEGPSFFWAAVKMVIALGLVLAMLLGISHFMKKYMDRFGSGAGNTAPGRAITVTETRHVAPKTQVMVIEALGSRYLIGVTPAQVTLIDKVPADGSGKAV